jgi:putative beta-lysine N-acetyltransferase
MPKTIIVNDSENQGSLTSYTFLKSASGIADAWAELYVDEVSLRVRVDDYFGPPDQILNLINSNLPDWSEKVIIKSRPDHRSVFSKAGYREEAFVHGYFSGVDMHFMTYYLNKNRAVPTEFNSDVSDDLVFPFSVKPKPFNDIPPIYKANSENAEEIASFYSKIFPVYPTPVTDPKYIKKVIEGDSIYRFIRQNGMIVSVACAEVNPKYRNAELSDCGTLKDVSGRGFMKLILSALMEDLNKLEVKSIYSIARAASPSMNAVFKGFQFDLTGTLIKNVLIYSGFEDMNVWSRSLKRERI